MGTSLNGLTPANTYQALIKVGNNTNLNTTLKTLSDGAGNDLPMQASTTAINFTGTVSGVASGVSGAIQFSNGSAFASDANNLFWDDTNNRLGIGTSTPSTTLQVGGSVRFGTGSVGTSLFWDNTNGRLSIGSSLTPSYPLEVNGQSFFNENIIIGNGDGIKFWVDKVRIKPPTTDSLGFYTGTTSGSPSERMRIDSAGNVGIGTNAPVNIFQVKTTQSNANGSIVFANNTVATILAATDTGSALTQLQFRASSYNFTDASGMRIASTGYATTPSAMLQIVGSGSTSATTSLLVQNSGGTAAVTVKDDLSTTFGGNISASNLILPNGAAIFAGTQLRIGSGAITILSDSANAINFGAGVSGRSFGISSATSGAPNSTAFLFVGDTATGVTMGSNSNSHASAVLDLVSTTKGFLPPRMTTTQKNAIASPAEGLEMYDSTAKSPAYYDGTNWGYTGGALQNAAGNSGTLNISFAAGNIVNLTLNANTTLAFSNAVIGTYIIQVTQGATGANVLTYPASVKWAGGTAPTLTTTVGKTDILTFYYDGTNFFGTYSLNY